VLSTFFINSIKLTYLEINSREIILKKELFYGAAIDFKLESITPFLKEIEICLLREIHQDLSLSNT